jgi:hypothetical protein
MKRLDDSLSYCSDRWLDLYRTNEPKPRLVMYVQSAYLKDRPLGIQRKSTLIFATICAETMGLIARR